MAEIKRLILKMVVVSTIIFNSNYHVYCGQNDINEVDDLEAQESHLKKIKKFSTRKKIITGVVLGSFLAGGIVGSWIIGEKIHANNSPQDGKTNETIPDDLAFIDPIDFAVNPISSFQKVSSVATDFMEQRQSDGRYFSRSSDLELPYESNSGGAFDPSKQGFDQVVGIYFPLLSIPRHASINAAHVNFMADELNSGSLILKINGDASLPSQDFSAVAATSRSLTQASVNWEPEDWKQVGASYESSDVRKIIQELVDMPRWNEGDSIALIFKRSPLDKSTNTRVAEVDPSLEIEYIPQVLARGEHATAGEGKEQAFDSSKHTKWLDFSPKSWIQYNFPMSTPKIITSYSITSANDVPARDPKDWQLLGSNDGNYWVLLDEQENIDFPNRFETKSFNFANNIAYSMYRIIFTENHGSNLIQLAEISFSQDGNSPPSPEEPESAYANGLINTYYEGTWSSLPKFEDLSPSSSQRVNPSIVDNVGIKQYGGKNNFALVQEGFINLSEPGLYTFKLRSDDGSKLYFDNRLLINNDGKHSARDRFAEISIEPGLHSIRVEYFEAGGGEVLSLQYSINGRPFNDLDQESLFHQINEEEPPRDPKPPENPEDPDDSDECSKDRWDHSNQAMTNLESGPLVGHTSHREANIWAYAGGRKNIAIKYQELDSCTRPVQLDVGTRSGRSDSSVANLKNLKPNTEYRYQFLVDNKIAGQEGVFKTAPAPDQEAKFSYLLASCMRHRDHPVQPAWDKVIEEKPDFHILNGDTIYITSVSRSSHWRIHKLQRGVPNFAEVIRSAPTYSTWDDHDFGENDSDGTKSGKKEVLEVWQDVWANPSFGLPSQDVDGVFYSFKWGNVEFFVVDNRYNRNHSVSKSRSTYLGAGQLNWLKNGLRNSRSPFKVIVHGGTIDGGGSPGSTKSGSYSSNINSWAYFPDLEEIYEFIKDNGIYGVVWNGGDIHYNSVAQYNDILDYPVVEFISSGIAKNANRYFTKIEVDTTLNDPIIRARHFKKDRRDDSRNVEYNDNSAITGKKEYRLSELTPRGARDLIVSGDGQERKLSSGDSHQIKWVTVGDIRQVAIEYKIGNEPWILIDEIENKGSYHWQIADSFSAKNVKLRVRDINGGRRLRSNVSPDVFNIY